MSSAHASCDRQRVLDKLRARLPAVLMDKFIPLEGAKEVVWAVVRVDPSTGQTRLFTEPTHRVQYRVSEPVSVTDYRFSNINEAFVDAQALSVSDKINSVFAMFDLVYWWSVEDSSRREARRNGLFDLYCEFVVSVCGQRKPVPVYHYCYIEPPPVLLPPLAAPAAAPFHHLQLSHT